MRLGLIVLLCLLNAGCALWRRDAEEPVENGPRKAKAEPVLKPSEALKPDKLELASPITDHFYMRGIYYQPSVTTELRLDPAAGVDGTLLNAEKDLGLDDALNQGRLEVDLRMRERNHLRVDYFKVDRFAQQQLPRQIVFGTFVFPQGTEFRSTLHWRVLNLTYTYSFFKSDRFEGGLGLGLHLIDAHAEGREPGTNNIEKADKVGVFPTLAANVAFRISKRWAVTARGQSYSASPEDFTGTLSDYHADIQYRWRRNFTVGLGYSKFVTELEVQDDQPLVFNMDTSGPEMFFRVSF